MSYAKYFLLLPFWVFCLQFISYAFSQEGEQRQNQCRILGIILTTTGIVSLVLRDPIFAFSGFALIMLGLRLIAASLDRINKIIFIDRYDADISK